MNRQQSFRKRRSVFVALLALILILLTGFGALTDSPTEQGSEPDVLSAEELAQPLAKDVLSELPVKGRAPKTGYSRSEFGAGWASIEGCDTRNRILAKSLTNLETADDECTVLSGELDDPYSGEIILFRRGSTTSDKVQIDHVVALSDAWQKGAQQLSFEDRVVLANDPLNLLAVDGSANQQKGDSDAASWLPANRGYRCKYVARQISVKYEYNLWVSQAEKAAMERTLNGCGEQRLPLVS